MNRFHYLAIMLAASLVAAPANANGNVTISPISTSARWAGSWEISMEAHRLLGFADVASRADSSVDHPISFRFTLDEKPGETIGAKTLEEARELLFRPMGHEVVATGKWVTKFVVKPGIGTDCFVTKHEGQTYLWVTAPFTVLYGGKVTFLSGADTEHDLLAFDFNTVSSERTPDTVVYRRKLK